MSLAIQLFLFYLAIYFVVAGLDEISIDLRSLRGLVRRWRKHPSSRLPDIRLLHHHPPQKIAIMVPLWREAGVIRDMVRTNLRQIDYRNYTFILGLYRNDEETVKVATELASQYENVETVFCSRPGPTSKADCLNHIFRHIEELERRQKCRFDVVMLHDAEDFLHPTSLLLVNWFTNDYGMVQVPVLPFPTGLSSWIHGVYCDEFAEFLCRDMPVRQTEGAFLPSNGVGTAIRREWLEELRDAQDGVLFDADCLTEDYELGMKLHRLGCQQLLLPMTRQYGDILATREYFPATLSTAVRQRSRWISGQCLQSWERHGWPLDMRSCYWFWRDRKGLWSNLLSAIALGLLILSAVAWLAPEVLSLGAWLWLAGSIPGAEILYPACSVLAAERALVRIALVSRIYGLRFAVFSPLRMVVSTVINAQATVNALLQFAAARWSKRRQVWMKTEHAFPGALPLAAEAAPAEGAIAEVAMAAAASASGPVRSVPGALFAISEGGLGFRQSHALPLPASSAPHRAGPDTGGSVQVRDRIPPQRTIAASDAVESVPGLRPIQLRDGELVVEVSRSLPPSERRTLTRHSHIRVVYVEETERLGGDGELCTG